MKIEQKEIKLEINSSQIPVISKIIKFRERQFTQKKYSYLSEGEFDSLFQEAFVNMAMNFNEFTEDILDEEVDFNDFIICDCLEKESNYIDVFFEFNKKKHRADGLVVKVIFDNFSFDEDFVEKAADNISCLTKKLEKKNEKIQAIEPSTKLINFNYKKALKATDVLGMDSWDSGFNGKIETKEGTYYLEMEGFSIFMIFADSSDEIFRKFTADDNEEFADMISNIFSVNGSEIEKIELR